MAKSFIASRTYDHKGRGDSVGFGRIGIAEFAINSKSDIEFTLNGQVLPAQSVDHLMTFALQTLQDAYAGADSAEDAVARFEAKLARILEGTLGTRSGGDGVSAQKAAIREVLRPKVKEMIEKNAAGSWKALDESERVAAIDAVFDRQTDAVKAGIVVKADELIARKKAEAEAKAALKNELGDLL